MTSFNPSHFPLLGSSSRTTGAAVHSAAPPLESRPEDVPEEPEHDPRFPGRYHAERHRRRHEREEDAKQEGLVPLSLPIPDLRFEQGYLLSIAPFLHLDETAASSSAVTTGQGRSASDEKGKQKDEEREERREIEEETALVEDAASKKNAPTLYLNPDLRIEWGMLIYVTLRDQLFWPLVQGAFWGTATLVLGQLWAARSTPLFGRKRPVSPPRTSEPPGKAVGEPRGMWERLVGSVWGGIQTNVVLEG